MFTDKRIAALLSVIKGRRGPAPLVGVVPGFG
jgi:hypothetical protein